MNLMIVLLLCLNYVALSKKLKRLNFVHKIKGILKYRLNKMLFKPYLQEMCKHFLNNRLNSKRHCLKRMLDLLGIKVKKISEERYQGPRLGWLYYKTCFLGSTQLSQESQPKRTSVIQITSWIISHLRDISQYLSLYFSSTNLVH